MLDKKLFDPMNFEEADALAEKLGFSSLSAFFEETGLATRGKTMRIKSSGEVDVTLRALLRLLGKSKGTLRDNSNNPVPFGEILGMPYVVAHTIKDSFSSPTYNAGELVLALPYTQGDTVLDGDWIIGYQGREVFGRLMVMPDGAWRFSRIGDGTQDIVFGPEHHKSVSLIGRSTYHIRKIGA